MATGLSTGWTLPILRVDVDGEWWDDDVQITHPGVVANLRGNLQRDAGGYFIQTRVRIPVCSTGVWTAPFRSGSVGLAHGTRVGPRSSEPLLRPDPQACP